MDDIDLRDFDNRCRLFPLPGVVLLPHAILPLHIFEPRYRQMTEDALAGDRLVTMVQLRNPTRGTAGTLGTPPIETVGCLGRIVQHERLPDGRFNFLLLGRKRVRLLSEVPTDRLYRTATADILEDDYADDPDEPRREELTRLFRQIFEKRGAFDSEMAELLASGPPLGVLSDIVGHALGLPPELKQHLLGEPRVATRADLLLKLLRQHAASDPAPPAPGRRPFPPPFSTN